MAGRIAWITVAPVKGMALEQRDAVAARAVRRAREPALPRDRRGRPAAERQAARRAPADQRATGTRQTGARAPLPRRQRRRGQGRARRAPWRPASTDATVQGRLVVGPWSDALTSFVGRALRLVKRVEAGAGVDRGRAAVSHPLHRLPRGDAGGGRESPSRSTRAASGCCSGSRTSGRTRRTRGSAAASASARPSVAVARQRRPLHRHQPPPGDRRTQPADARRARRVPGRHRDDRAAALRRLGRGGGAGARARSATASSPPERLTDAPGARSPSRRTSTTPTPAWRRCARQVERAGEAGDRRGRGAWCSRPGRAKRLVTFEDAERGLCFGRLDLDGVVRPLYVGRRWVHEEQTPIVVNWQAPAARPFYTATVAEPQGVALRRRFRTEGRTLLDLYDEPLDGSAGDVVHGVADILLEELERSRDEHMRDIVATIQADQYRLITREPEGVLVIQGGPGHRARPRSASTARRGCSTPTGASWSAAACWSSGRTRSSWTTSRTSCRCSARNASSSARWTSWSQASSATRRDAPEVARLKGDAADGGRDRAPRCAALPPPPDGAARASASKGVELRLSPERGRGADRGGAGRVGRATPPGASACA